MPRVLGSLIFTACLFGGVAAAQSRQEGPSVSVGVRPMDLNVFSGTWRYNEALSVDAATGRPERAPRSATQRPTAPAGGAGAASAAGRGGAGGSRGGSDASRGEGGGGNTFDEARRAMSLIMASERRTLVRDLLEVPEQLTVRATQTAVTFIDDLARERTYTTDGRLQKYQLSAARFQARGSWVDSYFRKEIEGAFDFKMSETYFVGDDGNRLYVIIRVGDPRKPETMAGLNRVYDRVSPPQR